MTTDTLLAVSQYLFASGFSLNIGDPAAGPSLLRIFSVHNSGRKLKLAVLHVDNLWMLLKVAGWLKMFTESPLHIEPPFALFISHQDMKRAIALRQVEVTWRSEIRHRIGRPICMQLKLAALLRLRILEPLITLDLYTFVIFVLNLKLKRVIKIKCCVLWMPSSVQRGLIGNGCWPLCFCHS